MTAPTWSDLRGMRVGLWGMGVEGRASLRRLEALGIAPAVIVADEDGDFGSLLECAVVVKSPGISRHGDQAQRLLHAGITVTGGTALWLAGASRDRVIAVTGTKGKSTTTAVAAHLLRGLGRRVAVGGNLGQPLWDPDYAEAEDADAFVVEVSSYQAADLRPNGVPGPAVVAVTSLSQDHLPWHGTYERYIADKLSLCTLPGVRAVVATGESAELHRVATALGPDPRWVGPEVPGWVGALGLLGVHNQRNAALAAAAIRELGVSATDDELAAAARGFTPLDSRLTLAHEAVLPGGGRVRYVDDSLSTNVISTAAAVLAFDAEPLVLIVGGAERGIDYRPLGDLLGARVGELLVLSLPDNGPRVLREVAERAPHVAAQECPDLEAAVDRARGFLDAVGGGVVLLSPAAPSFGRYRDYKERAAHFRALAARKV